MSSEVHVRASTVGRGRGLALPLGSGCLEQHCLEHAQAVVVPGRSQTLLGAIKWSRLNQKMAPDVRGRIWHLVDSAAISGPQPACPANSVRPVPRLAHRLLCNNAADERNACGWRAEAALTHNHRDARAAWPGYLSVGVRGREQGSFTLGPFPNMVGFTPCPAFIDLQPCAMYRPN